MQGLHGQQEVERQFRQRGRFSRAVQRAGASCGGSSTRKRDVAAERIRDEIDGVAKVGQRANPMEFAERCAPGSKNVRGRSSGCAWVGPACGSRPRGHEADPYILGVRAEYRHECVRNCRAMSDLAVLQSPDRMVVSFTYGGSQCATRDHA